MLNIIATYQIPYPYLPTCKRHIQNDVCNYTTIYCNLDLNVPIEVVNIELPKVSQWLAANKLSINVAKTKFIVFHMHIKTVTYPDLLFKWQ